MKVLFVNASSGLAGAERCLLEAATLLKSRGVTPIVALPDDGPLVAELRNRGIRACVKDLGVLRNRRELKSPVLLLRLLRQPIAAARLAVLVRREGIDVVHSNSSAAIAGAVGAFLARRPHVWHLREMLPRGIIGQSMRRFMTCFSQRIVCVSAAVREDLFGGFQADRSRAVVIPDGIDVEAFAAMAGSAKGGSRPERRIGVNSRINPRKGHMTFVEAASIVHRRLPETKFWIAGGCLDVYEPFKRSVASRAEKLGLDGNLIWAGQLAHEELAKLVGTYDILVLPSSEPEGLGIVLLEAMACGKPVIATAHGGAVEVVVEGVTGLLVPPDDPPAMATAVEALLTSEERRRAMGAAGAARVREEFSLEKHVSRLISVYESLTGGDM